VPPLRNRRLDIIRCVAVTGVMLYHGEITAFFTRTGWVGVDLFFVLSGFLISGLLFSEYKRRRKIDWKRFFIRRGLKIYPSFYVFLLATFIVERGFRRIALPPSRYLHEFFFVQNYAPGVWIHTWSLAVEEHFYIFLPLFLLALMRFSSNRENPFRVIPWACLAVGITCLALRARKEYFGTPDFDWIYSATHFRMDSLFFGVLLGYLYHFRPHTLQSLMRPTRNRLIMAMLSAAFFSLACLLPLGSRFLNVWGYTSLYLASGGVLALSLYAHGILPRRLALIAQSLGKGVAFIGTYSYSIYLWHVPCLTWLPSLIHHTLRYPIGDSLQSAIYVVASFAVGIVMSRLVEYPVLHLRDRLFPATQIVAVSPHGEASTEKGLAALPRS
jgi:peptidoglycan/LPS O-acetylase OafA/YrhL